MTKELNYQNDTWNKTHLNKVTLSIIKLHVPPPCSVQLFMFFKLYIEYEVVYESSFRNDLE